MLLGGLLIVGEAVAWFEQRPADPLEEVAGSAAWPGPAAVFGLDVPAARAPALWLGWERRFGLRELDAFALAADWPCGRGGLGVGAAQGGRGLWREQLLAAGWRSGGTGPLRWRLGAEGRRATAGERRFESALLVGGVRVEAGALAAGALLRLPAAGEAVASPEGGLTLSLSPGGSWRLLWREERTSAGETLGQLALAGRQGAVDWALAWLDDRGLSLALGWRRQGLGVDASLWWHPRLPTSRRFGLELAGGGARP